MKKLLSTSFVWITFTASIFLLQMSSCTKSSDTSKPDYIPYSDSVRVLEDIKLSATITKASPYDSAHNPPADSWQISLNRHVGPPEFLQNLDVTLAFSQGFEFAIDPANFLGTAGQSLLLMTYKMMPGVGGKVEINKVYESTYTGAYISQPFYLSMHSGSGIGVGKYFLSQDSIPPGWYLEPTG